MKSLAESILSRTGSGKNKKIDVEYLLKHGFEQDTFFGSPIIFTHKETGQSLRKFNDKIALDVFKYSSLSIKTLVVSTIEDLDLVIKWFKALKSWKYNNSNPEIEKLRKELFKNLEEI